jgi:hypothetical protein
MHEINQLVSNISSCVYINTQNGTPIISHLFSSWRSAKPTQGCSTWLLLLSCSRPSCLRRYLPAKHVGNNFLYFYLLFRDVQSIIGNFLFFIFFTTLLINFFFDVLSVVPVSCRDLENCTDEACGISCSARGFTRPYALECRTIQGRPMCCCQQL